MKKSALLLALALGVSAWSVMECVTLNNIMEKSLALHETAWTDTPQEEGVSGAATLHSAMPLPPRGVTEPGSLTDAQPDQSRDVAER